MPIRQYVTYGNLVKVIDLPDEFQDSMLEIMVRPVNQKKDRQKILDTIESLCGIAGTSEKTLDDYKKERLSKYEGAC